MNCKPGDLAYTVGMEIPSNNGRIVRVVRAYTAGEVLPGSSFGYETRGYGLIWVCTSQGSALLTDRDGLVMTRAIADFCLRPIRPQPYDATDETLEWLPVPTKQGETA